MPVPFASKKELRDQLLRELYKIYRETEEEKLLEFKKCL